MITVFNGCITSLFMPLVGVIIGGAIGFFSARTISKHNVRATAVARFRAAFAPALAQIELHRLHGSTHDQPDVEGFFKDALLVHAAAIEEFRPFVASAKQHSFNESWGWYVRAVREEKVDSWDPILTQKDDYPWHVVVRRINTLLTFAES